MILFKTIIAAARVFSATYERSVFSYRGISLRNRLNQECASSATHLGVKQGLGLTFCYLLTWKVKMSSLSIPKKSQTYNLMGVPHLSTDPGDSTCLCFPHERNPVCYITSMLVANLESPILLGKKRTRLPTMIGLPLSESII